MTWAYAMPGLMWCIDDALCLQSLTPAEMVDIESMASRISVQFRAIQAVLDSDESYERLISAWSGFGQR